MASSTIARLRATYHRAICAGILGPRGKRRILSNADADDRASVAIAAQLAQRIEFAKCSKPPKPQTIGRLFVEYTREFLEKAFANLNHIRPARWVFSTSQKIMAYEQYEHLAALDAVLRRDDQLRRMWPTDYLVTPDLIVARRSIEDSIINVRKPLVGKDPVARHTPLRASNRPKQQAPILHASVSCKWTIRSDRGQNVRTEALNLFRHRKGKSPHIVFVTMEPLPSRLAAVARGMGDVDCAYHAALYELQDAVAAAGGKSQLGTLNDLIRGRRLRDISDLPFDLAL